MTSKDKKSKMQNWKQKQMVVTDSTLGIKEEEAVDILLRRIYGAWDPLAFGPRVVIAAESSSERIHQNFS